MSHAACCVWVQDMRIAWEEPFGPVIPVIRVKNIDDAIDHCNSNNLALQVCPACISLCDSPKLCLQDQVLGAELVTLQSLPLPTAYGRNIPCIWSVPHHIITLCSSV